MFFLRFLPFVIILVAAACAQEAKISAADNNPIGMALTPWIESGELNGVVRVERNGDVLFEEVYGDANIELKAANTPATRFKLHSLSKPLTSAAVMRAASQDLLKLDDRICSYLNPCLDSWSEATIRTLLNHSSGIPDFTGMLVNEFDKDVETTYANLLSDAEALDPAFSSGTAFRYSNSGYVMLSLILENVYNKPFAEVLQEQIFNPAGMTNSGLETPPPADANYNGPLVIDKLASGYNGSAEALQQAWSLMYIIPGAGGVYTTAEDISKFANALFYGALLPPEYLQEMTQPNPALETAYALGIVARGEGADRSYRHDGGDNGFLAWMEYFPEDRVTIVILTNYGFAPIYDIRTAIREAVVDKN